MAFAPSARGEGAKGSCVCAQRGGRDRTFRFGNRIEMDK